MMRVNVGSKDVTSLFDKTPAMGRKQLAQNALDAGINSFEYKLQAQGARNLNSRSAQTFLQLADRQDTLGNLFATLATLDNTTFNKIDQYDTQGNKQGDGKISIGELYAFSNADVPGNGVITVDDFKAVNPDYAGNVSISKEKLRQLAYEGEPSGTGYSLGSLGSLYSPLSSSGDNGSSFTERLLGFLGFGSGSLGGARGQGAPYGGSRLGGWSYGASYGGRVAGYPGYGSGMGMGIGSYGYPSTQGLPGGFGSMGYANPSSNGWAGSLLGQQQGYGGSMGGYGY